MHIYLHIIGIEMRLSESTSVVEERERCIEKKVKKISVLVSFDFVLLLEVYLSQFYYRCILYDILLPYDYFSIIYSLFIIFLF